jgi:outer membrane protein, heavy metal efflux system
MRVGALFLLLAGLGCGAVDRRPLDPVASESEFRSRRLTDPKLRAFLEGRGATPGPWTVETLALVAFYFHPELDVERARVERARAGSRTASAWPNPVVGVDGGRALSPERGVNPWLYALDLKLPIDELWKRGHRIEAADHLADAARMELLEAAWRVRSRLRAALVRHLLDLREADLRRVDAELRAQAATLAERKLALGDAFFLDVSTARSERVAAELARLSADNAVSESRLLLAAALGVPGPALDGVAFTWAELDKPPAEESLGAIQTAGLLNRLDVRRTLAEYEAAEALLQLEASKRYPDISFGPSYEFEEGEKRFRVGLSITLPVFDQNQGPIAEALARRKEAGARVLAAQARVLAELESAAARYRGARKELEQSDAALSEAERREKAVRRSVELGQSDRTVLIAARLESSATAKLRLEALRKAQDALGDLEAAIQKPFGEGGRP